MIAILFAIFWNQRAVDKLEVHMDKKFGEVGRRFNEADRRFDRIESRIDQMQADLSGFSRWTPRLRT